MYQDEYCQRAELYCEIFELGQCDVALSRANAVLYGQAKTNFSCIDEGEPSGAATSTVQMTNQNDDSDNGTVLNDSNLVGNK